jgi:hypothetical protein
MAITVSFTVSQVIGSPENIVLVDSSTGTDVTAVNRRIYVTNAAGAYLTENSGSSTTSAYTEFPLADGATITLEGILTTDMAVNVTLTYVNVSGGSVATDTSLEGFTMYNETFYYSLTQAQASQSQPPPMLIQDSNYYTNKMILRVEIDSGNQAILYGDDITTAQGCYDRASYMVLNQNLFF